MQQSAAQLPQAWKKPPAYALHEDAETWQVIDGVELDQLIGSCVPDQVIKDWPTAVRVVQAFKMDRNEGSMHNSGWEWYRGKVCKKYKCCKDNSGAAYVWVRFDGDPYDCSLRTESLKRVAATPSSCAKCRQPAAPPNQAANEQVRSYARSRELQYSTSVCGRRLLRPLRVRQLLRVLSPCCVLRSCCSCLASDIRMCRHMHV